ncbi:hypothetical protein DL769_006547 [Monosporascus sp. CRB-8-3]|nr:hypothetical protein DL769_006547 [Monosporascus sp. CRB-8-3]
MVKKSQRLGNSSSMKDASGIPMPISSPSSQLAESPWRRRAVIRSQESLNGVSVLAPAAIVIVVVLCDERAPEQEGHCGREGEGADAELEAP